MSLDDLTIYVFVRNDLPLEQQFVQALHAAWHSGYEYSKHSAGEGVPYLVLIGLKNHGSLERAQSILLDNDLAHYVFADTDVDQSGRITAIATHPLDAEKKKFLAKYRLWRFIPGDVNASAFNGKPGANAAVAQSPLAVRCE